MKIVVNGREYDGIDQMPPEVRQQYLAAVRALGDADGNGVPDVLEQPGSPRVVTHESIIYNGREYKSREELPPEVRRMLEELPPPKPGESGSRIEVTTATKTKVLPTQVQVTSQWGNPRRPAGNARSGFPTSLIVVLSLAVLILLVLWLSGIRPADVFRK